MCRDKTNEELDQQYMRAAVEAACIAEENGDVPIGAVIVYEDRVIDAGC